MNVKQGQHESGELSSGNLNVPKIRDPITESDHERSYQNFTGEKGMYIISLCMQTVSL